MGYQCLKNNKGNSNTAIGYEAGLETTTGYNNVFLGYKSGMEITTGDSNTIVGYESCGSANASNGSNITTMGYHSMNRNKGDDNISLGYQSGVTNLNGDSNIFIGSRSGYSNYNGNNNLYIGSRCGYTSSYANYNTVIGRDSGYQIKNSSYNTYIGDLISNTTMSTNISDNYAQYNTIIGNNIPNSNGLKNTFIGSHASYSADDANSTKNVCIGYNAGYYNKGGSNICIGSKSGYSSSNTTSHFMYIDSLDDNTNYNGTDALIYCDFSSINVTINGDLYVKDNKDVYISGELMLKNNNNNMMGFFNETSTTTEYKYISGSAALPIDINENKIEDVKNLDSSDADGDLANKKYVTDSSSASSTVTAPAAGNPSDIFKSLRIETDYYLLPIKEDTILIHSHKETPNANTTINFSTSWTGIGSSFSFTITKEMFNAGYQKLFVIAYFGIMRLLEGVDFNTKLECRRSSPTPPATSFIVVKAWGTNDSFGNSWEGNFNSIQAGNQSQDRHVIEQNYPIFGRPFSQDHGEQGSAGGNGYFGSASTDQWSFIRN